VGRLSYSTGSARPRIADLYPNTTVTYDDDSGLGSIRQNDPGLKPNRSENYDLSLEYYFEPAGVVSIGLFRKDITDFISRNIVEIAAGADNGFGGNFAGFRLNTTSNLGSAKMEGLEFSYNQRLVMLPKPFDGLGLFANFTELKTAGTYANGVVELAGFVPRTVNAGLSYTWRGIETRASWRYKSAYFMNYNADQLARSRLRPLENLDFSVKYNVRRGVAVYFDVYNILNSPEVTYNALNPQRVILNDLLGTRYNLGVSGRF
jgi:TonB-dependent receptor